MRYDILKVQFSHTLSLRGATVISICYKALLWNLSIAVMHLSMLSPTSPLPAGRSGGNGGDLTF